MKEFYEDEARAREKTHPTTRNASAGNTRHIRSSAKPMSSCQSKHQPQQRIPHQSLCHLHKMCHAASPHPSAKSSNGRSLQRLDRHPLSKPVSLHRSSILPPCPSHSRRNRLQAPTTFRQDVGHRIHRTWASTPSAGQASPLEGALAYRLRCALLLPPRHPHHAHTHIMLLCLLDLSIR